MKCSIKIACILFCILNLQAKAQTYFNKVYNYIGTSSFNNAATSSYEYSNGDFLISGQKYYSAGFGALCFIRINSSGDTIYYKRYPKPYCKYYGGASGSLIKCYDNNLAQSGSFVDSSGNFDALLVKLTESGDTLWTRTYGGPQFDNANIVCQTPDSGFVLMGVTQSFSTGPASDFYLIKTDKNGNQLWQHNYGTTLAEDCVSGQITLDGGYILSGIKNNLLYVLKTDSAGNFQWDKQFASTAGTGFVKQLTDSTYLVVGAKLVSGLSYQAYMVKLSADGNSVIWQQTYGGVNDQQFYTIPIILSDGSIVCAGETSASTNRGILVKTDAAGNEQWLRTYYANPSNNSYIYDLKATSDNGFIMVGSGSITGQDAWVVKTDEFGCEMSDCSVGINEQEDKVIALTIYPNPANDYTNVEINIKEGSQGQFMIYNLLGKEIQKQDVSDKRILKINTQDFTNGIYLFVLQTSDGNIEKQKVIISK